MSEFKLSDEVVAQVAKLVQLAIITGTDVVDNLRMLRVTESDDDKSVLVLTPEYRLLGDEHVEKLMSDIVDTPEMT
ncbi:hypothetical protein CMI47_18785 [Candidatus Pacearchaeota archaeon]|nr:hypothetical protein [Candidatus Pacearchaeota archaeon]|tara:strand:+ start:102 stop:329 length:228 start_codon:yes stop_codon:yes gene_type:complete